MLTYATDSGSRTRSSGVPDRKSLRWLTWIVGAALLAAVVVAALHFSEAREFAQLTERAEPWWLILAVLFQVGTYLAQGQVFRCVFRAGRFSVSLATASRLSVTKLFVDQAVPTGGLSGTVVLANALERRGMNRPVVVAAIVVEIASYYAAYVLSLALALIIAATRGEASTIILLVSLVFALFAIALSALVMGLSGGRARALPRKWVRFRPLRTAIDFMEGADPRLARKPRLLLEAGAYQLGIVLFDAATVWVLIRSLGAHASPSGVFASFMIASLLRTIGFMPGGLGTFEAASVLTLRMVGVPVAVALAATLLFRGLSFWLPMLPGLWFSRREMGRHRAEQPDAHGGNTKADTPVEELLAHLGTSMEGLSTAEARRRLDALGPNEPTTARLRSKVAEFLRVSRSRRVRYAWRARR